MPIDREVSPEPDLAELRVVIRASSLTADTRKRAVTLEAAADVVLGSARPAFATLLARSLLGDR